MNVSMNSPVARRGLMGALLAAGTGGLSVAAGAALAGTTQPQQLPQPAAVEASRQRLRHLRTPNVPLLDHNGRSVRFYDDVMRGRKVVLNAMYTVCSNVCTPATFNLMEARRLLGDEAKDLHFVSLSLTPLNDTPEALRQYKKLHGIDESWTFLTGKIEPVEKVQRALGFISDRPGDDLLSHSAMARVCEEHNLRWSHVNTLLSGRSIARMIRFEMV